MCQVITVSHLSNSLAQRTTSCAISWREWQRLIWHSDHGESWQSMVALKLSTSNFSIVHNRYCLQLLLHFLSSFGMCQDVPRIKYSCKESCHEALSTSTQWRVPRRSDGQLPLKRAVRDHLSLATWRRVHQGAVRLHWLVSTQVTWQMLAVLLSSTQIFKNWNGSFQTNCQRMQFWTAFPWHSVDFIVMTIALHSYLLQTKTTHTHYACMGGVTGSWCYNGPWISMDSICSPSVLKHLDVLVSGFGSPVWELYLSKKSALKRLQQHEALLPVDGRRSALPEPFCILVGYWFNVLSLSIAIDCRKTVTIK